MREQITAVTNKTEAYHGFSEWLRFGGEVIGRTVRRFGDWVLDLSPPEAAPVTALNLAPGALFPSGRFDRYPG